MNGHWAGKLRYVWMKDGKFNSTLTLYSRRCTDSCLRHRRAFGPPSVMNNIGLSLISEHTISDRRGWSPTSCQILDTLFYQYQIFDIWIFGKVSWLWHIQNSFIFVSFSYPWLCLCSCNMSIIMIMIMNLNKPMKMTKNDLTWNRYKWRCHV